MTLSEELRFRAGDASLAGTLTLPSVEGRAPWALLVPSWLPRNRDGGWDTGSHPDWFGPTRSDRGLLLRLADALAERGVGSLRYDPRGSGASDGTWEATPFFTRIDDARDAIGAMRSRRELDLRRTAIVGHGEGAGIALSVAIADPAIGAVGLIGASARSLRSVLRRGVALRGGSGRDLEHPLVVALDRAAEELIERTERGEPTMPLAVGDDRLTLDLAGWEQAIHTPPLALATMLHREVVLIHGSDDVWADPDESRLLAEILRAGGNDPTIALIDGADHDLDQAGDADIDAFADALVARMQPRELPPVLVAIEQMSSG
jgi:pimeloyl-ACP methyl ester carboxylesterase